MNLKSIKQFAKIFMLSMSALSFAHASEIIAKFNGNDISADQVNAHFSIMMDGNLPEGKKSITEFPKNVQENVLKSYLIGLVIDDKIKSENFAPSMNVDKKVELVKKNLIQREYILAHVNKNELEDNAKKIYAERFKDKEEIKASHILVKTEAEAKTIHEELKKNANKFSSFVEKSLDTASKANGGSLGYFSKGQMVAEFEQTAFATKVGQMSKPVKTDFGWHIIKVEDRRTAPAPKYEDVKPQLMAEAENVQVNKFLEDLYSKSKVELLIKNDSENNKK